LSGYADQSPILCEDGTIFAISNDYKNPTIRNLDANGQTVFEIVGEMPDSGASAPSYPQEHDVVQPLARLALSRSGELYAAARNGKIYAFKAPGGLSTSDWPKNYGGYENASRVTKVLPQIVSEPESVAVVSGSPATLSVGVTGRPLPTVRWDLDGGIIPGAGGRTLRVGTLGHDEEGDYHAVVENELGSVESEPVTVTVSHRLTVNSTGLGSVSVEPLEPLYEHLAPVIVSATPAAGFIFEGWSGSSDSLENPLSIEMDYSKSLTARFKDTEAPMLILNETTSSSVPVLDSQFALSWPLQFGENTLQLIVRDRSGLETVSDQVILWEPRHYWTVEGPESLGEAKVLSTKIYLGSPGDVAGANISVTSNPALLTYLTFKPAKAISRTFQTLSEENGIMNLTFASLSQTIPAGKTLIGTIFYRVRSLPQPMEHAFILQQTDLAGADGSPIEETSGIRDALVALQPRGIMGDVNTYGRFDVGDAQRLQRLLGGLANFRPWDSALNDANGSGSLDIGDIIVVL
jgi:hypothetical protein